MTFLLINGYAAGMDFLRTTTHEELERLSRDICRAAAEDSCKMLIGIDAEYNKKIQSEIALGEINQRDFKKLQGHAHATRYSALYNAILCGSYDSSKALLVNLSSDFFRRYNPKHLLHTVCFGDWHQDPSKTIEIIELMLKAGADIKEKRKKTDNDGWDAEEDETPLDVACARHSRYKNYQAPEKIRNFLMSAIDKTKSQ